MYISFHYPSKYFLAEELLLWRKIFISGRGCGELPCINTVHTSERYVTQGGNSRGVPDVCHWCCPEAACWLLT